LLADGKQCHQISPCFPPRLGIEFRYAVFPQDVNQTEAGVMAVVQKPINQSILGEKSGPPAWKQLPTWFQIMTS
jgi:hypothetical protein